MKIHDQRRLCLTTLLCLGLGGCSAHASFGAGSISDASRVPVASGSEHTHSSHGQTAENAPAAPAVQEQALQQAPTSAPVAQNTPAPAAPVNPAPAETHAKTDHDRGHGNDADGVDEDNPGKSSSAKQTAHANGQDHDRGHGNDADGVDEDNPGKSKKKKK